MNSTATGWRLHLTNQAIQRLDLLDGQPPLLAAWSRRDRVAYYDLETGAPFGETTLSAAPAQTRQDPIWQVFLSALKAPNEAALPLVRTPLADVFTTEDGRIHLYHTPGSRLFLETEGKEISLETDNAQRFPALVLDRFLGLCAALDEKAHLHVYQQHMRVGVFDLGLSAGEDRRYTLAISRGGGAIYASDGRVIVLTNSTGQVIRRISTYYLVGEMACSPDGHYLVASDMDTGVLRVYKGGDLSLIHQRFAIDLIAQATQLQLIADLPPVKAALSALTIDNDGNLAFAMSGVICMTNIAYMDSLPRPENLLSD